MITGFLALTALAAAPAPPPPGRARLERELKSWVQARIRASEPAPAHYSRALADLNGDHAPEALVYLSGRDWCGSGGCNLYILHRQAGRWQLVNSVTIAKPPIRIMATKSRGWSDIGVYVSGGGITHGYEAVLRFSGVRYPGNPTVAPAFRAGKGAEGRTVIPRDVKALPVFP